MDTFGGNEKTGKPTTGNLPPEKEPLTAWGKEVGGLQSLRSHAMATMKSMWTLSILLPNPLYVMLGSRPVAVTCRLALKPGRVMHLSELSCDSDQTQPAWDDAATGDERELIERFKNDVSVVAVLYRRHHEAIALYILRHVGCVHETEDLTAETFVAMVKYLLRF